MIMKENQPFQLEYLQNTMMIILSYYILWGTPTHIMSILKISMVHV